MRFVPGKVALIRLIFAIVGSFSIATIAQAQQVQQTQDQGSGQSYVLLTAPGAKNPQNINLDGKTLSAAAPGAYIVAQQAPGGNAVITTKGGATITDYNVVSEEVLKPGAKFIEALGGDPLELYRTVTLYTKDPKSSPDSAKTAKTIVVFKTERTGDNFGTQYFNGNSYVTHKVTNRTIIDNLNAFYKANSQYRNNIYIRRTDGKMFKYHSGSQLVEGDVIFFGPKIAKNDLPR